MTDRRKICSLDQLLARRAEARAAGRTVVHCHGCFDVVHPGHIHHLQHARTQGDFLIVSVSSDAFVNKGVNRPLIPHDLRCDSLAALECVDSVYVNPYATAFELIEALKPDIFVKGSEYETSVDPRFLREKAAVVAHGGRVYFSSGDVVYSSTALIGSLTDTRAFSDEKTARFCRQHDITPDSVQATLRRCRGKKVVVVGDYILDRYHFCEATGLAGEAPMMALRTLRHQEYDGGAAVIARHAAGLGADVTLFTALPDDTGDHVRLRLAGEGVRVDSPVARRQIISKNRYLVDDVKMFKVDEGSAQPLDSRDEAHAAAALLGVAGTADCVIFADFGYGLLTPGLLDRVMPALRAAVPVITADVSGRQSNLLRFKNIDLLCPTEREMRETLHDFTGGLGAVISELLRVTEARAALVTLGKQGLVACDWPGGAPDRSDWRLRSEYLPALTTRAIDPLGCGDALLAAASIALACGVTLAEAAFIGSLAAGVEAQLVGNVTVTGDALLDACFARDPALFLRKAG